jgi:hypothetical protein
VAYAQADKFSVLTIIETVMQAMAVLLLEMAYEHKHLKEEKSDIVACIKKMIRWLHAMRANDPVASRAYDVVFKILKSCAPKLQDQVKDIIADDLESVSNSQPYQATHHQSTAGGSSLGVWNTPQHTDSSSTDHPPYPPQFYPDQSTESLFPYTPLEPQSTGFAFGNPFITNFDEGVPLVDMQSLWWNTAPTANMGIDLSGMVASQNELQQQMQQQMHQEMQGDGILEQPELGGNPEFLPDKNWE